MCKVGLFIAGCTTVNIYRNVMTYGCATRLFFSCRDVYYNLGYNLLQMNVTTTSQNYCFITPVINYQFATVEQLVICDGPATRYNFTRQNRHCNVYATLLGSCSNVTRLCNVSCKTVVWPSCNPKMLLGMVVAIRSFVDVILSSFLDHKNCSYH